MSIAREATSLTERDYNWKPLGLMQKEINIANINKTAISKFGSVRRMNCQSCYCYDHVIQLNTTQMNALQLFILTRTPYYNTDFILLFTIMLVTIIYLTVNWI
jgi:hypothetical protein